MSIPYRFMPWARLGLARTHQNADSGQNDLAVRPKVNVGLTLQAKQDDKDVADVLGKIDLTLYGPGDVIGIDPRLIVRTEPKPNITNFEPNYLAAIDFDPPDFPWLLTPAKANSDQHLRPWLVLVVLDSSVVNTPKVKSGQPLPSIDLTALQVKNELPDLSESWLWAHAQAVSELKTADDLAKELPKIPAKNISRLVCPRRLKPDSNYIACVVPAFEAGLKRGLGKTIPDAVTKLTPAWSQGQDVELPVYYHWEFSTGPVGDIETLARRLRTPAQYQGDDTLIAKLRHIGEQPVAVDADHLLFTGKKPDTTQFEGAMVSLDFSPKTANKNSDGVKTLEVILNSGQELANNGTEKSELVPTLSPPIYGEHQAKSHKVDNSLVNSHVLDQLNLQPRYRLAAGWGAEVVRQNQDEFMQASWTQIGEVLAAERALSLSRFAHDILKCIEKRHLKKLPEQRYLAVIGAARARIKVAANQSLYGRIDAATLPEELFDGAMRRLTSARRATFKMAQFRERALGADKVSMVSQMTALVNTFANASENLSAVDPNRFVPDGIMGSRSFDNIPLPRDPEKLIDLEPYTGLPGSMTAGEVRKIVIANKKTLEQAAKAKPTLPKMSDIWKKGLLTDTHQEYLSVLLALSGYQIQGDLTQIVQQASKRGAEFIELAVSHSGRVSAKSVKLDKLGGDFNRLLGNMPLAIRLGGDDLRHDLESISLSGRRTGSDRPASDEIRDIVTITMPAAIRDRVILERYATAFVDYQKLWVNPQKEAHVSVQPLNFAVSASSNQTRSRLDPAQTVPARLASMFSLADHAVTWSRGLGFKDSFISTHLHQAMPNHLRFIIPRTFDRVMAYPHLAFPLSKKLEKIAPEVFLPGVSKLPDDFIMAVKTNPRFVEALMLGANHEMGRELLWQGFPTDQRGTPFQHFWQRLDQQVDIEEIHRWNFSKALGEQPNSTEMLVLLIRGQLLERFPTLSIYAYPKNAAENRPGGSSPPAPAGTKDPKEMNPKDIKLPVMKGHLGKDITYVGFDIKPNAIQNYFFILEEQMTEPRFGFDEPDNDGQNGSSWLDVDWSEVNNVTAGSYFSSVDIKKAPPAIGKPQWNNPHAATIADALLQRPFRGYYAGVKLKMPN